MEIHNQIFYTTMCSCVLSFTGKILIAFSVFSRHFIDIVISLIVKEEHICYICSSWLILLILDHWTELCGWGLGVEKFVCNFS